MFGRKRKIERLEEQLESTEYLLEISTERIRELTSENIRLRQKKFKNILNERTDFENHYNEIIHKQKVRYEKEIKELKEKYNVREFDIGEEVRYGDYIYEVITMQDDYLAIECISSHSKDIIKLVKSNDLSLGKLSDDIPRLPI